MSIGSAAGPSRHREGALKAASVHISIGKAYMLHKIVVRGPGLREMHGMSMNREGDLRKAKHGFAFRTIWGTAHWDPRPRR